MFAVKMLSKQLIWSALISAVAAQLPPVPVGVTVLKSKFHENVTISYKEVNRSIINLSHWN